MQDKQPNPLDNLQQQIWDERDGRKSRYLLCSTFREARWEVALWSAANSEGKSSVWAGEGDDTRANEIADAITAGMMHVEPRPKGGFKVFIHVPKPSVVVYVDEEDPAMHLPDLVDGSFALLSRPKTDSSEVRALTTQLEERDAEIAALQAKLLNLRSTTARQTATGPKRDGSVNDNKKMPAPAALNRLQPNAKRRKLVEEEFAGSDSEEEEDDDDDDEE